MFDRPFRRVALICAVPAMLAQPALADPTVGFGFSLSFGGGTVEPAVGVRIFSDDRQDTGVGTLGLDYMFGSQSWRGTVGAAYLGNDNYIGVDLGIGLGNGAIGFGATVGVADTKRSSSSGSSGNGEAEGPGCGEGPCDVVGPPTIDDSFPQGQT